MSNPALNKAFGSHVETTPAGYPAYPGYRPQGGQQTQHGQSQAYGQQPQWGQAPSGQHGYQQPQMPYYGQQPGYTSDPNSLEQAYRQPSAGPSDTRRMTMDDVITRTAMTLGVVVLVAVAAWWFTAGNPALAMPVMWTGLIVGLILGLVNAFKREPSPALIMAYAAFEGLFLGAISMVFNMMYPGIVSQAVMATIVTFAVTLVVYRSGLIKVNAKFVRFVTIALISYAAFCLVNLVLMLTNIAPGTFGLRSGGLGLLIGAAAVLLATFSLMIDFKMIEEGIARGVPNRYAWSAAFGLTVTLIWLYIEFLRIIAILRGE